LTVGQDRDLKIERLDLSMITEKENKSNEKVNATKTSPNNVKLNKKFNNFSIG
jgi:hypothetical protein